MTRLALDGTQVRDFLLLSLQTKLKTNLSADGLSFHNTAATKADKHIAKIAEFVNKKDRATALFAYQKDVETTDEAFKRFNKDLDDARKRFTTFETETNARIETAVADYNNRLDVMTQALSEANALRAPVIL